MDVAPAAAVEIDRLVITLNRRVRAVHGPRLREAAGTLGLDSLDMLPHFEDWLLAGTLTPEVITRRLLYRPPDFVSARLDELAALELIAPGEEGWTATPRLRPLFVEMLRARAQEAQAAWHEHDDDVDTVTVLGRRVADAASAEHLVAVSHRALPDPDDPYLRLEHRLFTMRYIRQHDHAVAWAARGLAAPQIVALTRLWHGDAPAPGNGSDELVGAGLVTPDHAALTPEGRELRESIEAETNRLAAQSLAALGEDDAAQLLDALRRLPSAS